MDRRLLGLSLLGGLVMAFFAALALLGPRVVLLGVLVAGEWVLAPIKLLSALVQDVVAPAIAAIRKALLADMADRGGLGATQLLVRQRRLVLLRQIKKIGVHKKK